MKKVLFIFGVISLLTSCQDGDKGKAYIRIINDDPVNYDLYLPTYVNNNSAFPSNAYYNTYYETSSGTFHLFYELSDGTNYYTPGCDINYVIDIEKGEVWNAISDGYLTKAKSGKDRYYTIHFNINYISNVTYSNEKMIKYNPKTNSTFKNNNHINKVVNQDYSKSEKLIQKNIPN